MRCDAICGGNADRVFGRPLSLSRSVSVRRSLELVQLSIPCSGFYPEAQLQKFSKPPPGLSPERGPSPRPCFVFRTQLSLSLSLQVSPDTGDRTYLTRSVVGTCFPASRQLHIHLSASSFAAIHSLKNLNCAKPRLHTAPSLGSPSNNLSNQENADSTFLVLFCNPFEAMPRRPLARRRSLKRQTLAFSPFMRSLAIAKLASTSRSKSPHPEAGKSSEKKPFDKEFSESSKKKKKEQLLESSDEEDPQGVVQADFEFFDPKAEDFHGVRILLQNYLDDKEWDLSGFVDLILGQTTVGTVVKVADDEDDGLFAIVSVLNLERYKDNKSIQELKDFLLKVIPEKSMTTDLKSLLEEKAQDVGLLISQRVLNLPPQLLSPLYEGLFDEVSWATEDEPSEELRSSFRFKTYLLVTKIYKLKNAEKRKKLQSKYDEETIFVKPEDELFLELSSWSFTFPLHTQLVTSQELRNYRLTGLVMAVEANKIPEFRQKLQSFVDGP